MMWPAASPCTESLDPGALNVIVPVAPAGNPVIVRVDEVP